MTFQSGSRRLVYALVGFLALFGAWNSLATRFGESQRSLQRHGDVFDLAARNLRRTLAELPPPELPRIVVYGSSQIATVRGESDGGVHTTPHLLSEELSKRGLAVEVADFSDGGQVLLESLIVHFGSRAVSKPSVLVIGVSLFSMQRQVVRPTLIEALDVAEVRDAVRAAVPDGRQANEVDAILEWSDRAAPSAAPRHKSIQQQLDVRIATWLTAHVPAYANRQVMFNELIDTPIRRDLLRWIQRRNVEEKTATHYPIGDGYPIALLALETIARAARDTNTQLLVVVLPFDDDRPPIPFEPDTQARILGDLEALTARTGSALLDLGHLLPSEHFGDFQDGSPDNLHYDADGHARVGARIAEPVARLLTARAAAGD